MPFVGVGILAYGTPYTVLLLGEAASLGKIAFCICRFLLFLKYLVVLGLQRA